MGEVMAPEMVDAADEQRMRRLINWLEQWAEWQRGYRPKTGFPPKSCGLRGYGSTTFDEMADAADEDQYRILDAAIDDLGIESPIHKAAVMCRYLAVGWRFPRGQYADLLVESHAWLIDRLPLRGFVL